MDTRILICEDEKNIVTFLKAELERAGYATDVAFDGEEALRLFAERAYQLVLLDLMLPLKNGLEVLQVLRKTSRIPVIILTARKDTFDKVLLLKSGADDYVTKPFDTLELLARIERNIERDRKDQFILIRDLSIDFESFTCSIHGQTIKTEALAMNDLIENLLFFARTDNRRMLYDKKSIDLSRLLLDCVTEQRLLHPDFTILFDEPPALYIVADDDAILSPRYIIDDEERIKAADLYRLLSKSVLFAALLCLVIGIIATLMNLSGLDVVGHACASAFVSIASSLILVIAFFEPAVYVLRKPREKSASALVREYPKHLGDHLLEICSQNGLTSEEILSATGIELKHE